MPTAAELALESMDTGFDPNRQDQDFIDPNWAGGPRGSGYDPDAVNSLIAAAGFYGLPRVGALSRLNPTNLVSNLVNRYYNTSRIAKMVPGKQPWQTYALDPKVKVGAGELAERSLATAMAKSASKADKASDIMLQQIRSDPTPGQLFNRAWDMARGDWSAQIPYMERLLNPGFFSNLASKLSPTRGIPAQIATTPAVSGSAKAINPVTAAAAIALTRDTPEAEVIEPRQPLADLSEQWTERREDLYAPDFEEQLGYDVVDEIKGHAERARGVGNPTVDEMSASKQALGGLIEKIDFGSEEDVTKLVGQTPWEDLSAKWTARRKALYEPSTESGMGGILTSDKVAWDNAVAGGDESQLSDLGDKHDTRRHLDAVFGTDTAGSTDPRLTTRQGFIQTVGDVIVPNLPSDSLRDIALKFRDNKDRVQTLVDAKETSAVSETLKDLVNNNLFMGARDAGHSAEDAYNNPNTVFSSGNFDVLAEALVDRRANIDQLDAALELVSDAPEDNRVVESFTKQGLIDIGTQVESFSEPTVEWTPPPKKKPKPEKKPKPKKAAVIPTVSIADLMREANRQRSAEANKQAEEQRRRDQGFGWGDMWT